MPNDGINAIIEAHKFIKELLKLQKKLQDDKNDMFSIPYTTINIGTINGGDAINKVPDKCTIKFDARTIKEEHNILIENEVKKILKNFNCKLEISINIKANINKNNEMISKIEEITQNKSQAENYVTEASFLPNTQAVILGVGPITAHQCDEYINTTSLKELVKIYDRIIEEYCF